MKFPHAYIVLGTLIFNVCNTASVSAMAKIMRNAATARHFRRCIKGLRSINAIKANPPMTVHTMRYTSCPVATVSVVLGSFRTLAKIKVSNGNTISNSVQTMGSIVRAEVMCSTELGYSVGP